MNLFENPITKVLHDSWCQKINERFPELQFSDNNTLSFVDYIENSPQKFYSKEAYQFYLNILTDLKVSNSELLKQFMIENQNSINRATTSLDEVNKKPIHDVFLPEGDLQLYQFIDKEIHYNYLRLLEGAYFVYISLIASHSRIKRGKKTEGLDLFNCIQEIEQNAPFITDAYNNTIRNGIAHGSVIFQDSNLIYTDKKGNSEKISKREIVKKFDFLVDICNGLALAFQAFIFTNLEFFYRNGVPIPQSVLLRELKFQSDGPAWEVVATSESITADNRTQLIIYVENFFRDYDKVQFNSFRTAYLAAKFTKKYDRIFLQLDSKYSSFGRNGWAAFDGKRMKENILNNSPLESYAGIMENNGVMFLPKIKLPRVLYKLGSFIMSIKIILPLALKEHFEKISPDPFLIRETRIHSKAKFAVVQDPSVVVKEEFAFDLETLIRTNVKKIVRRVERHSRQECSRFTVLRYLPIKYIRVFVYQKDKRVRALRNSGLISELICTIEVNTTKKTRTIDISGGTPEQYGKYRIVWNANWKKKS
ncbi:MAG: hypothetical protein ABJF04_25660 [Reichenbachiella sp.]|uniref:hypothetical protein n=1 Tax=Reichenbachiella sp. TaxID=2184521 RepID=UPI0032678940